MTSKHETGVWLIQLDLIDVADRLRPVEYDAVALIAGSMGNDPNGQLVPIKVREIGDGEERYQLVAGAHRLAAAKALGWENIRAEIFEGSLEDALVCEIDENLCRAELSAADQAIFILRKLELFEEDGKKLRRGRDLRKCANLAHLNPQEKQRFYKLAEKQFGMPRRTTQRALRRGRVIPAALFERMTPKERDDGALLEKIVTIETDHPGELLKRVEQMGMAVRVAVRDSRPAKEVDPDGESLAEFVKAWRDPSMIGHDEARKLVTKWLASRARLA